MTMSAQELTTASRSPAAGLNRRHRRPKAHQTTREIDPADSPGPLWRIRRVLLLRACDTDKDRDEGEEESRHQRPNTALFLGHVCRERPSSPVSESPGCPQPTYDGRETADGIGHDGRGARHSNIGPDAPESYAAGQN